MTNTKERAKSREEPNLKIVKTFDVAPEVVFDALTKPEAMQVWWTDETDFDIDLREGGTWKITRTEGDMTFMMTGEYLEVDRPQKLTYTISMPQYSPNSDTVSVNIGANSDGGCDVTFIQSGPDISEELKALKAGEVSQSEAGWQQGFDLMKEAWKDQSG